MFSLCLARRAGPPSLSLFLTGVTPGGGWDVVVGKAGQMSAPGRREAVRSGTPAPLGRATDRIGAPRRAEAARPHRAVGWTVERISQGA